MKIVGKSPLDLAHPPSSGFPMGIEIPSSMQAGLSFLDLASEVPLLLLPVRIETRYRLDSHPPELRIRIFPDQVHIDADTAAPGAVEAELTREFWTHWDAAADEAGRQAAWRTFVRRVDSRRAGYLARLLRPTVTAKGKLVFPQVEVGGKRPPARPLLLPRQWVAVGYSKTQQIFLQSSREVSPDLRTAPDPEAPPWEVPASGVTIDEGLAWMFDYDRALETGMAITVPLTGDAAEALTEVSTLLVVGVDSTLDHTETSAELDRLLGVHARTGGLAFVPQGTPTNNTASVTSGWTREDRELADLAARELEPLAPVEGDNAGRLASALGIADATTLRRVAFGTDNERGRSRAMIRVAYEAILGTFVRRLLQVGDTDAIGTDAMNVIRDWCVQHVTGGAPYPALRIGPQPYGFLPVRRSTATDEPATAAENVQTAVSLLIDEWRRSSAALHVLDPNATDVAGSSDHETAIATILATQPHPARLFVRRLDDYASLEADGGAGPTPQWAYVDLVLGGLSPTTNPNLATPYKDIADVLAASALVNRPDTIDGQIEMWSEARAAIQDYLVQAHPGDTNLFVYIVDAHDYMDAVLDLLSSYEQRQRPVRWLDLDVYEGALGEANTKLVEGVLRTTSTEWGDDGIVQAHDAAPGHTAADYLAELRTRFDDRKPGLPPSKLGLDPEPLLYQLLDRTLHLVPRDPGEEKQVGDALDLLAAREPDELEWLLRESLGLGTHRLDAWATSLAVERLKRLRDTRPAGVQIGAFGWVTELKPRETERLSGGFVHAPSMSHAATAAVLRAGWHTHGTDDPLSPVAVDLRSSRVRAASWLLDGVRQGQDLGDLLGYRFERTLHDLGADEHIRPVRTQVLAATDRPNVPADEPVDGIELLDLYRAGGLTGIEPPVQTALDEIESAFDAVNDAGLFESVHQLVTGNLERATATLDALATGTRTPPELRAPRTPRAGTSIEHRVLLLLDPDAARPVRGWLEGRRDAVAPALEAWVESFLPAADAVGVAARAVGSDRAARPITPLTLADLGLSALDALWLVGDDPRRVPPPLRTLVAGRLASDRPFEVDTADKAGAEVSLSEFTVLAVELRRAVDSLRPADARDLRPARTAGEPDSDDSTALDAAEALIVQFDSQVDRLDDAIEVGDPETVAPLVEWMARIGLGVGAVPTDLAAAEAVHTMASRRLTNVGKAGRDVDDRRQRLERQLAALVAGRLPLLGTFPLAAAPDGEVVDFPPQLASSDEVDDWLDAIGRVRPGVARLTTAGMLSELLAADGGLRACAGQSPILPGETWAASTLPAPGTGGRLSTVAVVGPGGPPAPGASACGIVVDRWTERIPRSEQVTGVAFQFDAPSNQPPQSCLLAVTPDGESWSLQLVLDTLLETLEWATLRAVGPEDLGDYGRAIPSVFVPGDIANWPAEDS